MNRVSSGALWVMVAASGTATMLGIWASGLLLIINPVDSRVLTFLALPPVLAIKRRVRSHMGHGLIRFIEATGLFSAVCMIGAIASYVIAANTQGYADDRLAAMDGMLGFDWLGLYRLVALHPWIGWIGHHVYLSIFASPVVVIAGLVATGRAERAHTFIAAFGLALAIALLVFAFFPAQSALMHHVGGRPDYMSAAGMEHVSTIAHLRDGTLTRIDPANLVGLITFPSMHTISALLFIWAAWPVRGLREAMIVLNAAMLASVPIEGAHYLVDMIAGAAVAAFAVGTLYADAIVRRMRRIVSPVIRPAFQAA